ncbi:hypothetical protein LguiA_011876 [Lonicera macranthoides]
MSKRVSTTHITRPEIIRQELSHSFNDLEENAVEENKNVPEGFKLLCFKKIGKSWRSFKNRVNKRYYKTLEADLEHRPPRARSGGARSMDRAG